MRSQPRQCNLWCEMLLVTAALSLPATPLARAREPRRRTPFIEYLGQTSLKKIQGIDKRSPLTDRLRSRLRSLVYRLRLCPPPAASSAREIPVRLRLTILPTGQVGIASVTASAVWLRQCILKRVRRARLGRVPGRLLVVVDLTYRKRAVLIRFGYHPALGTRPPPVGGGTSGSLQVSASRPHAPALVSALFQTAPGWGRCFAELRRSRRHRDELEDQRKLLLDLLPTGAVRLRGISPRPPSRMRRCVARQLRRVRLSTPPSRAVPHAVILRYEQLCHLSHRVPRGGLAPRGRRRPQRPRCRPW